MFLKYIVQLVILELVIRYRAQRATSTMVLGSDGGTIRQRARAVPALRVGPDAAAASPAGSAPERLCATGNIT